MSPPRPRPRESGKRLSPDDRRAQILELAVEQFGLRPYAELTISDVAQAAGITQGLVYHYFPNKEALFTAAFEQRAQELLERCLPPMSLPLLDQVEAGVKGYLGFVEAHAIAYWNLFRGPTSAEPDILRTCEGTRQVIVHHFLEALGVSHLQLPATKLALRGYVGYVETVVLAWLDERVVERDVVERLIFSSLGTALVIGLASDAEVPPGMGSLALFQAAFNRHFGLT